MNRKTAPTKAAAKSAAAPSVEPRDHLRGKLQIALSLLVFIAFGRLLVGEFTPFDDAMNLYENPRLNPPTFDSVAQFWKEPGHGAFGLYVPLTYTVWGVLARTTYVDTPDEMNSHLDPHVFHAVNILAHALTACAVFSLLNRLLKHPWAAAFGAAVFALHPLQAESVGWVSGLKDVMSGLFCVLALLQHLAAQDDETGVTGPTPSRRRRRVHGSLAFVCFVAAMLCKPTAMVTPALVFVLDVWFLRRPLKRVLIGLVPWVLVAIPFAAIARLVQDVEGVPNAPLLLRPIVAGDALAFYLWKFVSTWPLIFDYEQYPAYILHQPWGKLAWLLPLALGVLAWRSRKRQPLFWLAALLFVIPLLPNSGLATFQYIWYSVVADHYVYVAMIGPALALAWLAARYPGPRTKAICALWLCLLLGRTIAQAGTWSNYLTLAQSAIHHNPGAFMARGNLGFVYDDFAKRYLMEKKIPEAREAVRLAMNEYETASRLRPDSLVSWVDLISLNMRIRDMPAARKAAFGLDGAVAATPERAWLPAVHAYLDLATDPQVPLDEALHFFSQAVAMHPHDPDATAAMRNAEQYLAKRASRPATTATTNAATKTATKTSTATSH